MNAIIISYHIIYQFVSEQYCELDHREPRIALNSIVATQPYRASTKRSVYCFIVSSACVNSFSLFSSRTRALTVTLSCKSLLFIVFFCRRDIVRHAIYYVHHSTHSRQVTLVFLLSFFLSESEYCY